ncbi:hypothetical protein YC2023_000537 [Brassica napus]
MRVYIGGIYDRTRVDSLVTNIVVTTNPKPCSYNNPMQQESSLLELFSYNTCKARKVSNKNIIISDARISRPARIYYTLGLIAGDEDDEFLHENEHREAAEWKYSVLSLERRETNTFIFFNFNTNFGNAYVKFCLQRLVL